ncbi:M3 family metallopeptidase [Solimonas marina]|uniref:Dipeptidyl carboxypeptidase n=1 Tax=Solimonas marina TaxID=2714601 RepID=A0A969WE25_9GAMM|nr:M3 family metallopeptidase [Solimonas marina]NKF23671.1 M3 family metallopeptidase [Solimonas marina]
MKTSASLALTAGLMMSAGDALADSDSKLASQPFVRPSSLPYALPPFDRIGDGDYEPAFVAGMAEQRREVDAIAHDPAAPSFDNTIVALERSGTLLNRVSAVFFNLAASNTNDAIDALQARMAPQLAAHRDAIFLDPRLYARVQALYNTRRLLELDAESARLLERYHTMFVRAGAELADAQKAELRQINAQLSELHTQFSQNLLKDTNAAAVVVDERIELDGLSDAEIAAAAAAAQQRGLDGKYVITLMNTSGQPPLADLKNRAVRERVYRASITRGANGNAFDNRAIILQIVGLTARRAELLGYASHAAYVLDDETARTPAAVNAMLGQLAPAAVANARREMADMQQLVDAEGGTFELAAWDWAYYAEKLRKARYDFDESQMKPYLEMDRVLRDGVFYAAQRLYGLSFSERKDLPVYHPDVRVFEVFNEDGSPLGLFLADFYKRDAKRGGAWMSEFVSQSGLFGTRPVVVNNLNVPKPPDGEPTLLSFDEVTTMFHEFGHALHGLFSDVKYPLFTGTSVPRDFVEYPSQLNEMWATDPEVLRHYARHHRSGEPMPAALLDKVLAAQKFNQGFATTEYLGAALLDQQWYQQAAGPVTIDDVEAFETQALQQAGVALAQVPPRYRSSYFAHVFTGGYDAGYYAYIWSEVLDADTAQWFRAEGGAKRESGERFRRMVLARGGSADAIGLFRAFIGHDPQIGPLLERRGLAEPGR